MKKILIVLILNVIVSLCYAQEYFPLQKGNEYFYGIYKKTWGYGGPGSTIRSKDSTKATDSIVLSGKKFRKIFNQYYSYDAIENKLYILIGSGIKLAVNFNKITGGDSLFYNGIAWYYTYKGLDSVKIGNEYKKRFRISYYYKTSYPWPELYPRITQTGDYYFVEGVGLQFSRIYYDYYDPDTQHGEETFKQLYKVKVNGVEYNLLVPPKVLKSELLSDSVNLITFAVNGYQYETGIYLERCELPQTTFQQIDIIGGTTIEYEDYFLDAGKKYLYRFRSAVGDFHSSYSDTLEVITILAPYNIKQVETTYSGVLLSWSYDSDLNVKYIIERKKNNSDSTNVFVPIDTVSSNTKNYLDTNKFYHSSYIYRIKATYQGLQSKYSSNFTAYPRINLIPANNLSCAFNDYEANEIKWISKNIVNVNHSVERKLLSATGSFETIAGNIGEDTVFVDETIVAGATFLYRIISKWGVNSIAISDTIQSIIPLFNQILSPSGFKAEKLPGNKVKLTWNDNSTNEKYFRIYRGKDSSNYNLYDIVDKNKTSFIDTNAFLFGTNAEKFYFIRGVNSRSFSPLVSCYINITGIKEELLPTKYALQQNYPNPFNPITTISFTLPENGFVKLVLYDITGKEVEVIVSEELSAGIHSRKIDCKNMSSGFYILRLIVNSYIDVKKIQLIK